MLMMFKVCSLVKAGSDVLRHIKLPVFVQEKLVHASHLSLSLWKKNSRKTLEKLEENSEKYPYMSHPCQPPKSLKKEKLLCIQCLSLAGTCCGFYISTQSTSCVMYILEYGSEYGSFSGMITTPNKSDPCQPPKSPKTPMYSMPGPGWDLLWFVHFYSISWLHPSFCEHI